MLWGFIDKRNFKLFSLYSYLNLSFLSISTIIFMISQKNLQIIDFGNIPGFFFDIFEDMIPIFLQI